MTAPFIKSFDGQCISPIEARMPIRQHLHNAILFIAGLTIFSYCPGDQDVDDERSEDEGYPTESGWFEGNID